MEWKKKRLIVMMGALVITLSLLISGKMVYQQHFIEKPVKETLQDVSPVTFVEVFQPGNHLKIKVGLGWTDQLPQVYVLLHERLQEILGDRHYEFIVQDERTPQLISIFSGMDIFLQEAISRGNFSEMAQAVKQYMYQYSDIDYQMHVDREYVYVSLRQGNHYLYEILPRLSNGFGINEENRD